MAVKARPPSGVRQRRPRSLRRRGESNYEGEDHELKAGDIIYFEEGGCHSVETAGRMKMALMLTV